ncbi:MAG: hypothetical protein LC808_26700 [Actinobacteria bacterium]|nr:hypothetical protein [Actinomycetota bacterium]
MQATTRRPPRRQPHRPFLYWTSEWGHGNLSVTADASDDVAVLGVQFKVDGNNLGSEDITAPYAVTWNTASFSEGSHTLTAVARDAVPNSTTSAPVTVTVDNVASPTPPAVSYYQFRGAFWDSRIRLYRRQRPHSSRKRILRS